MQLYLASEHVATILKHVYHEFPREACGIIAGRNGQVQQVIPVANVADQPEKYYRLDDRALAACLMRFEQEGVTLLGFYHSHPQGDPVPSQTDIHQASYHDVAYLIIGLRQNQPSLAAWCINHHEVTRIALQLGGDFIAPLRQTHHQAAIFVSAGLALLLFFIIAFSLLPAPP